MNRQLLNIIFILFSLTCSAQYKSTKMKMAEGLLEEGKYYASLRAFKDIAEKESENIYVINKIAELSHKLGDLKSAEKWYAELLRIKVAEFPKAEYNYAIVLKELEQYKLAIEHFESFNKSYRGLDKALVMKLCKAQIKGCEMALNAKTNNDISVSKLPNSINSPYNDLAPFFIDSTLYYTGLKTDSAIFYEEINDSIPYFEVFSSKFSNGKWDSVSTKFIPNIIGEDFYHISNGAFNQNKNLFVYTECKQNINGKMICKIYATQKTKGIWSEPKELGNEINDPKNAFTTTHPNLAFDEKKKTDILFFSSDMPGGLGGYDIWQIPISKDLKLGKLENLGRKVNSIGDDLTPHLDQQNKKFYFSSNGHIGFGGLDIFVCPIKGRSNRIGKPLNMGLPVNSPKNDWYYFPIGNNNAFFSSNRKGANNYYENTELDDIYMVKYEPKRYVIIKAYNDSDSTLIQNINVKITELISQETYNYKQDSAFRTIPNLNYNILFQKNGFINRSKDYSIDYSYEKDTTYLEVYLTPIQPEKEIVLNNIYFASNSFDLNDSSKTELNKLLILFKENPSFIIEISAHTDDVGKEKDNLVLSQKRAESVMNFLIEHGVGKEKLKAVGYGASKPVADPKNPDGSINEEARQKNRRISFKIIDNNIVDDEEK